MLKQLPVICESNHQIIIVMSALLKLHKAFFENALKKIWMYQINFTKQQ